MLLRKLMPLALLLACGSMAAGAEPKDRAMLQGTWRAAEAELAGKKFPDEVRMAIKLEIKGDKYIVAIGKNVDQGSVKIDPAATPKTLDIVGEQGPNKGKTFLCIYELKGDTLRVCYDLSGENRPTEFKTSDEAQVFLVTYKRETR